MADTGQEAPSESTLELINSELTERLKRQNETGSRIDTKSVFLAGFAATATQFLATKHPSLPLGAIAFSLYGVSFGFSLAAMALTRHQDVPEARQLLDGYALKSKVEVLSSLSAVRVRVFEKNKEIIKRKTVLWWVGVAALFLGVAVSVVAILQTGSHDRTAQPAKPTVSPTGPTTSVRPSTP